MKRYLKRMNQYEDEDFFQPEIRDANKLQATTSNEKYDLKHTMTDKAIYCESCNGTGAILKTDDKHYIYAYKCTCANQVKKPNLPRWG